MNDTQYTWKQNSNQPGRHTEEGQWHSNPHPHLVEQIPYLCATPDGLKPTKYWHPDYVVFKGSMGEWGERLYRRGWWVDCRTAQGVEGPFQTRREALDYCEEN